MLKITYIMRILGDYTRNFTFMIIMDMGIMGWILQAEVLGQKPAYAWPG